MANPVLAAAGGFLAACVPSFVLLVRLSLRYNAPAVRPRKRPVGARGSFMARKSRQQEAPEGGYYIVEYAWEDRRGRERAWACRMLGKPPDEIRLKKDPLGRILVVDGGLASRTDDGSDPYISGERGRFPRAGLLLPAVPLLAGAAAAAYLLLRL